MFLRCFLFCVCLCVLEFFQWISVYTFTFYLNLLPFFDFPFCTILLPFLRILPFYSLYSYLRYKIIYSWSYIKKLKLKIFYNFFHQNRLRTACFHFFQKIIIKNSKKNGKKFHGAFQSSLGCGCFLLAFFLFWWTLGCTLNTKRFWGGSWNEKKPLLIFIWFFDIYSKFVLVVEYHHHPSLLPPHSLVT